jgi:hypothetical protein
MLCGSGSIPTYPVFILFILKVSVEESIVNAQRIIDHGSAV